MKSMGGNTVPERKARVLEGPQAPGQFRTSKKGESYYDILQVTRIAHPNVIMKAYKALASVYHPDRSTPTERARAEERMKLINIAYETLSDSRKRAEYDKSLED